jgi:hypothetical protein
VGVQGGRAVDAIKAGADWVIFAEHLLGDDQNKHNGDIKRDQDAIDHNV